MQPPTTPLKLEGGGALYLNSSSPTKIFSYTMILCMNFMFAEYTIRTEFCKVLEDIYRLLQVSDFEDEDHCCILVDGYVFKCTAW